MTDINRERLRCQLLENYEHLARKLTRRLGSSDVAYDVFHETFLRLDRVTDAVPVRRLADYIFRIAVNLAKEWRRAQRRRISACEIEALLDISDDQVDPARVVEARLEIEAFKHALAELPTRLREVMHSISVEGQSAQQVAARLRVSIRTVETDLKLALSHCAGRLCDVHRHRAGVAPRKPIEKS